MLTMEAYLWFLRIYSVFVQFMTAEYIWTNTELLYQHN